MEAFVSRLTSGASYVNTIRVGLEPRTILILQGKQFHNEEVAEVLQVPLILTKPASERRLGDYAPPAMRKMPILPIEDHGSGVHTLVNADAGVHFTIIVKNKKSEFEAFLDKEDVHLIYCGHARYGRGPCFGKGTEPGEEWEDGDPANLKDTGLFRMGFNYIPVPASEITKKGYTANVMQAVEKPPVSECHPDLRGRLGKLRARTASEIDPKLPPFVRDHDSSLRYWTYVGKAHDKPADYVILRAGWQDTTTKPHELGAHFPKCRVFAHFGCSTYKHNHSIVREKLGWKREDNERYAFFTTATADIRMNVYWLNHILTYKKWNAFESWEPSLKYALKKANRDLARDGVRYRLK
jgi:hypothetical protein